MILRVYLKEIICIAVFAVIHGIIFHFPDLSWLAFVSLIPLLLGLELCSSSKEAFALGYIAGALHTLITYYWILHVTLVGTLAMAVYLGAYTGLFAFLAFRSIQVLKHAGEKGWAWAWFKILGLVSLWVLVEYFRSNIPIMKFPWALWGYSQWQNLRFIQIADKVGPFGVSGLIAVANFGLYFLWVWVRQIFRKQVSMLPLLIQIVPVLLLTVGLLYGNDVYGQAAMIEQAIKIERNPKAYRVSLVQGNIPQDEKWDEKVRGMIFDKYEGLTRQLMMDDPELIVWPETSFPGYWEYEPELVNRMYKMARDLRSDMLIGAPTLQEGEGRSDVMNSALHLSKNGGELMRHHKLRLVPFGEYIPFFKFVRNFFDEIGEFVPGKVRTLFTMNIRNPLVYSVLICFEDIFPDLCRLFVKDGSQLLINITNDAWFKDSKGPYQHAQASVFRAVENRVPVIRAANTGLSCFINPIGQITETIQVQGENLMVTGFKTAQVKPRQELSFYTQYGDLIVLLFLALFIISQRIYINRIL